MILFADILAQKNTLPDCALVVVAGRLLDRHKFQKGISSDSKGIGTDYGVIILLKRREIII